MRSIFFFFFLRYSDAESVIFNRVISTLTFSVFIRSTGSGHLNVFDIRYSDPENQIFNRVISAISVVVKDTTLTISDSSETGLPVESKILRVVSLITREITEITRLKKKKKKLLGPYTLIYLI